MKRGIEWERRDLNPRSPTLEAGALSRLRGVLLKYRARPRSLFSFFILMEYVLILKNLTNKY